MAAPSTVAADRASSAPRRWAVDALGWAVGFCIIVLSARSGGGYFPVEYLEAGIASLVAAALILVLRRTTPSLSRRALVATVGLGAYATWIGLSAAWSPASSAATAEFQRTVSYTGVLLFGVVAVGSGRGARGLLFAVWAAFVAVAIAGVLSRLLPSLDLAPPVDLAFQGYRLTWPISYWNAQGTATAMAVVLGIGIVCDRRSHLALRAFAAATIPMLLVGILFTVSRGSFASLVVGLLVVVALSRRPLQSLVTVAACVAPGVLALVIAAGQPALVDDPAALPRLATAGPRVFLQVLALGALAAALAVVAARTFVQLDAHRRRRAQVRRPPGWFPVALLGVGALILGGLLASADHLDGSVAGRTTGIRTFVDTQRSTFLNPKSDPGTVGINRLTSAGGSRSDLYRVAIDQFEGSPIHGAGTGAFAFRWLRDRTTPQPVQNAHSLPLEALAETGIIGFLLLGTSIGAIVWGAVLARRRPGALPRSLAAGASAAIATFFASCAVDWTWQMGNLTAGMLLLAATLLTDGRRAGARSSTESAAGAPSEPRPRESRSERSARRRRRRRTAW